MPGKRVESGTSQQSNAVSVVVGVTMVLAVRRLRRFES